jgi:hypothetical protein
MRQKLFSLSRIILLYSFSINLFKNIFVIEYKKIKLYFKVNILATIVTQMTKCPFSKILSVYLDFITVSTDLLLLLTNLI